jgi:hypothetical protein
MIRDSKRIEMAPLLEREVDKICKYDKKDLDSAIIEEDIKTFRVGYAAGGKARGPLYFIVGFRRTPLVSALILCASASPP